MTAEGYVYELIFEGPADDSPDTLRRLKGVFIADLNLSVEEVQSILQQTPATIFRSDDKNEVQRCLGALKSAGAKVLLVAPKSDTASAAAAEVPTEDNSDGYVIEFNLNDPAPEEPKEPKTYSLDLNPEDETEILDLTSPDLDLGETTPSTDELGLGDKPVLPKQRNEPTQSPITKKSPNMLGSSPLISAPETVEDFGFALDDEPTAAVAPIANSKATTTTPPPASLEQPVIPPEITAKQTQTTPAQLDESAGLDELLAIAEQNEEKQGLFDDLAIRELDEQKLVESAVKSSDDDFSLDLKPDAPSKVENRPTPPAASEKVSAPSAAASGSDPAPAPQVPPVAPPTTPQVASAVAVNAVAPKPASQPERELGAVAADPSVKVEQNAASSSDSQAASTSESTPASNRAVIIFAVAAVAIFILGNWLYLYVFRSAEVTNEDLLQVLPKTTIEKHAAKVEGATSGEDTTKKAAVASTDATTVTINDSGASRTIQAKFKIQAGKPVSATLVLTTPQPPELTPEQIVHNDPAPLWLERLETDELSFESNETGRLSAHGPAKLYLTQAGNNSRAVAQLEIDALFDAEKGELTAAIVVYSGDAPSEKSEQLQVLKNPDGTVKVLIVTHIKGAV